MMLQQVTGSMYIHLISIITVYSISGGEVHVLSI